MLIDVRFGAIGVWTDGRGLHEKATRGRLVARGVVAVSVRRTTGLGGSPSRPYARLSLSYLFEVQWLRAERLRRDLWWRAVG